MLNKKFKRLIPCLLLFVFLFLTGCSNQSYKVIVNEDLTSKLEIKYTINKDIYETIMSYEIEPITNYEQNTTSANPIERCNPYFQKNAAIFHHYGFEIEPIEDAIEIGFKGVKKYSLIKDLNDDIKKMHDLGLIGLNGEVKTSESLFEKGYLFSGTVDFIKDPDFNLTKEDIDKGLSIINPENFKAEVFLRLPGDLVDLDGIVEQNFAKYTVSYNDQKTIPVHLQTKIVNKPIMNIVFIAGAIGGITLLFFVSKSSKKRKEAKKRKELYGEE